MFFEISTYDFNSMENNIIVYTCIIDNTNEFIVLKLF